MVKIQVINKVATAHRSKPLVCGNSDYQIQFIFDNEWSDYETKTARFIWNGKYEDVIFTGDICNIPVIDNSDTVLVGVYAGDIHTTTPAILPFKISITSGKPFHHRPSEDIYNKLLEQLNNIQSKYGYYSDLKKVKDYLYTISYNELDYSYAYEYFKSHEDTIVNPGMCSAVRNDNWYGRNFDWPYSNQAEFITTVPHIGQRYASIGVAGGLAGLTNDIVKSKQYSDLYKILPFMLQDGINECGLIANMNAVPIEDHKNTVIPTSTQEVELSAVMIVRYILDNFNNAESAVTYIKEHARVYFPKSLHDMGFELHFMVADKNNTYCLEFYNDSAVIIDLTDKPFFTNFVLNGVQFNPDGKVYTNADVDSGILPTDANKLSAHASGLERYNMIADLYNTASTKDGMRSLMDNLKFSRAYITAEDAANPRWYSEYLYGDSKTVDTPTNEFEQTLEKYGQLYLSRSRNEGIIWQTVHSAIYDMNTLSLHIVVQEDGEELSYSLNVIPALDNYQDGSYVLQADVTNGLVNYKWVPASDIHPLPQAEDSEF